MIVGTPGNEIPCAFELKLRFAHEPESERLGNKPERAWRTRAAAASARKPAIWTAGGGVCAATCRTASANESRSGAGACATSGDGAARTTAATISLRICNAMEIEVDVGVEVFADVEAFGHAGRKRLAGDDGVHQRRHRELRGDHHVHGPEFARFDTALDDAGHEPVPACHDFFVIEAGKLGEIVGF